MHSDTSRSWRQTSCTSAVSVSHDPGCGRRDVLRKSPLAGKTFPRDVSATDRGNRSSDAASRSPPKYLHTCETCKTNPPTSKHLWGPEENPANFLLHLLKWRQRCQQRTSTLSPDGRRLLGWRCNRIHSNVVQGGAAQLDTWLLCCFTLIHTHCLPLLAKIRWEKLCKIPYCAKSNLKKYYSLHNFLQKAMEKKKPFVMSPKAPRSTPRLATTPVRCELRPCMIPFILLFGPTNALVWARSETIFFPAGCKQRA